MPGSTHLGPSELPTDFSSFQFNITTGPTLVILIMIARHPSAISISKLRIKKNALVTSLGIYRAGGRWSG